MALSDGLLGSFADMVGGYFGRVQAAKQAAMEAPYRQQLNQLIGQAPTMDMGPPDPQGGFGAAGGTGLLANPQSPTNQLNFATGIMGLPGLTNLGAQFLQSGFQRAQQGQQFGQEQERLANQFNLTRTDTAAQHAQAQENFNRQFERAGSQFDITNANEVARLGMERQRLALAQSADARAAAAAAAPGANLPALPQGWGYQQRNGEIVAAPAKNTPDYQKAIEARDSLTEGIKNADFILNTAWGAPRQVNGETVRAGGVGFEAFGENSAPMALAYGQLRSALLKAQASGVIDKGEREAFEQQLGDPSTWTGVATKGQRKAYEAARQTLLNKQKTHMESNSWLIPELGAEGPNQGAAGAADWLMTGRRGRR
jgi:hypothetical protein